VAAVVSVVTFDHESLHSHPQSQIRPSIMWKSPRSCWVFGGSVWAVRDCNDRREEGDWRLQFKV